MMYQVVWLPDAEAELADIWSTAVDRRLITDASNRIDRKLKTDPSSMGESRPRGRRIYFEWPLAITLEVIEDDRLVRVLEVWRVDLRDHGT